jgi:ATP-binding cassette, subfamily B, bacterial
VIRESTRRADRQFAELEHAPYPDVIANRDLGAPRGTPSPDKSKSWTRRILPIVKAHRWTFGLSLTMSFIALLTQVQIPNLVGTAINKSVSTHAVPIRHYATLIIIAIVIREIANYIGRRNLLQTAYLMEYDLRCSIYEHLMGLSFPFYDNVQSGQLISRSNSDVRAVQMYLVMAPTVFVQCAVVVIAFIEMFTINVPLTLVTMCSLPLSFGVGVAMRKKIFPVSWLIQARLAEVATIVEENISGVRVVKSFAAEQAELNTLSKAAARVRWGYTKDADIRGTWAPTLENLPRIGLAVILLYGGVLVLHGHLEVGTLFTFQAYMLLFQPPFRQLGMVIMMGQRASASAKRIYEVLDTEPEIVDVQNPVVMNGSGGHVEINDLTFGYGNGAPVISHLSLELSPGETVALVGRTGSGKSTLGRLINRSYDPTGGSIRIDGIDLREYDLDSLRRTVGVVFDEPFLFSISIRDNIAFARPDASFDDVRRAAKAAAAEGFIESLPEGYDTVIGERGYTLSGGQRQRLAIARTLLLNPPVLILDDATSAIDVQVEQQIHQALRSLLASRTTLIIAHRLSTIALATRVALIDDGEIIAIGTHEHLLETEPRYVEVLAHADKDDVDLDAPSGNGSSGRNGRVD